MASLRSRAVAVAALVLAVLVVFTRSADRPLVSWKTEPKKGRDKRKPRTKSGKKWVKQGQKGCAEQGKWFSVSRGGRCVKTGCKGEVKNGKCVGLKAKFSKTKSPGDYYEYDERAKGGGKKGGGTDGGKDGGKREEQQSGGVQPRKADDAWDSCSRGIGWDTKKCRDVARWSTDYKNWITPKGRRFSEVATACTKTTQRTKDFCKFINDNYGDNLGNP